MPLQIPAPAGYFAFLRAFLRGNDNHQSLVVKLCSDESQFLQGVLEFIRVGKLA
jgi:hypothetical protein